MAKKISGTNSAATSGRGRDERRAIHYYTAPDGTSVREELHYPEPKKLSKFGKWMDAHPNGIIEILDMKAVMK
jgi:hypothetical protein